MSVDLDVLPAIPRDAEGPVFREPWEAQAFALTVKLHEACLFTWSEWAATLSGEIKRAQAAGDADLGPTYYRHWLAALERLVTAKGVLDHPALDRRKQAWVHAYERTPHGKPVTLQPGDEPHDGPGAA
jgi:nitrile hydratase accessory protein